MEHSKPEMDSYLIRWRLRREHGHDVIWTEDVSPAESQILKVASELLEAAKVARTILVLGGPFHLGQAEAAREKLETVLAKVEKI